MKTPEEQKIKHSHLNKPNICILLTATIDTKNIIFMKRKDPIVRENDYLVSIKKWLDNTAYPLIFCENSGYSLKNIERLLKSKINRETEILQFNGQDYPREYGKGYGELLTIKYVIQHSVLSKKYDYMIKVTGRYYIKNIKRIATGLSIDNNIYIMADLLNALMYSDSRVFAFKTSFINEYLSKYQDMLNDSKGFFLEHALAHAVLHAVLDGYKWAPLSYRPGIIGYSGTDDIKCNISKVHLIASKIVRHLKNIRK